MLWKSISIRKFVSLRCLYLHFFLFFLLYSSVIYPHLGGARAFEHKPFESVTTHWTLLLILPIPIVNSALLLNKKEMNINWKWTRLEFIKACINFVLFVSRFFVVVCFALFVFYWINRFFFRKVLLLFIVFVFLFLVICMHIVYIILIFLNFLLTSNNTDYVHWGGRSGLGEQRFQLLQFSTSCFTILMCLGFFVIFSLVFVSKINRYKKMVFVSSFQFQYLFVCFCFLRV